MLTLSVCICIWLFIVSLSHPVSALLALNAESDIHCHVNIEFMTVYMYTCMPTELIIPHIQIQFLESAVFGLI